MRKKLFFISRGVQTTKHQQKKKKKKTTSPFVHAIQQKEFSLFTMQIESSSCFLFSVLSFATLLLSTLADHDHLEEQRRDRIIRLPGQPSNVSFSQFSGYITLGNPLIDDYHDSINWHIRVLKFCPNNTFLFPRNECHGALERAYSEFGDINPYSIDSLPCNKTSNLRHNLQHSLPWKFRGNDECEVKYTERYMNRPEVQSALHANITRIPHSWVPCSSIVRNNWSDSPKSMLPIFRELIAAGIRIWVFRGDADAILPLTATRYSINALQLETSISWHAWYDDHQQVNHINKLYKVMVSVNTNFPFFFSWIVCTCWWLEPSLQGLGLRDSKGSRACMKCL
uniref:Uncharacterized protein n=1 Tax=Salix viminalis TaxID=40686 RepID=A0A6N2LR22_SALVM